MFPDNETAIANALGEINALAQSLRANGKPRLTPRAEVDGKSLADALRGLQKTIDEFLAGT
jgi:hypothetical protein